MMYRLLILFSILCFKTEAQTSVLNVADSLFATGHYSKAIEVYKQHETPALVYDKIAKAYMALGNYDVAIANYENSIASNKANALIKLQYGRLLYRTKAHKKAAAVFNDLVYKDYRNPNYQYELGLTLAKLKDSTAQNRFYNAVELDSTHQKAIYQLAKFHLKKKHYELVHKYCDKGLSSYENNKELINLKAQKWYIQGRFDRALIWFEKLEDLNSTSEFVYDKLSDCYAKILDYEKGIAYGEKVYLMNPLNTKNLWRLGQLYNKLEAFEKSEKYMNAALTIQDMPLDREYIQLGMVLNRQKKYKEALKAFEKAVVDNPDSDKAFFFCN